MTRWSDNEMSSNSLTIPEGSNDGGVTHLPGGVTRFTSASEAGGGHGAGAPDMRPARTDDGTTTVEFRDGNVELRHSGITRQTISVPRHTEDPMQSVRRPSGAPAYEVTPDCIIDM